MARTYSLNAWLNFQITDHAQFTSLRTTVINFVQARAGEAHISVLDRENAVSDYKAFVHFTLPCTGRAQANTYMSAVDNALPSLPTLIDVAGYKLRYELEEKEI